MAARADDIRSRGTVGVGEVQPSSHGRRPAGPRQSGIDAHEGTGRAGFVGEVLSVHVSLLRDGVLSRPSHRTWQREIELGANTLTIAAGHTVDAMRFVTGDFTRLSSVVATQAKQWLDTGTGKPVDVTSPDNVLLNCLGARIRPMPPHLVSRRALRDSDGDWHAEPCHLVENVACDLRFGPLIGQNPSVEAPANDGLVAIHRGFSQAPAAVA